MKIKKYDLSQVLVFICAVLLIIGQLTVGFSNIFFSDGMYVNYNITVNFISAVYGICMTAAAIITILVVKWICKWKYSYILFIIAALILRLLILFIWKIEPVSDFKVTLDLSKILCDTPIGSWKETLDNMPTPYNNEWSAHMPFIMYQTFILKLFGGNFLSIQIVNGLLSFLTCIFASDIAKKLFGDKAGIFTLAVSGLNPVVLFFLPVLTNQHSALFFFTAALWVYIRKPVKNKYINIILCGVLTALSHLLRPEMYIVIIAFGVLCVYDILKNKDLKKVICFVIYTVVFFGSLFAADKIIQGNITNRSILSGNLKYKIVVGLNKETLGCWSSEDNLLVNDEKKLNETLKTRITPPPVGLMIGKAIFQTGEFTYDWSMNINKHPNISQLVVRRFGAAFMALIILMSCGTLINYRKKDELMIFTFIILCFAAVFAVIEIQPRYSYLLISIFPILSSGYIKNVFRK